MRRKIIIVLFLTLLSLGVSAGWGGYYGKGVLINITRKHMTIQQGKELSSRVELFVEWLKQWEQEPEVAKFIRLGLEDEWIIFATPVVLGVLVAVILTLAIFIFIREESSPTSNRQQITKAAAPDKPEPKANDAVELLSCLQKEGRLIDFLQEDISSYDDAQVGAAVRSIHQNTRKALEMMVTLEPVMAEAEGDSVEVEAGFDPSAIRLTGNIKGDPPFSGTVCQRGWKVTRLSIESRPLTHDLNIIEPSEVEIA